MTNDSLVALVQEILRFRDERDWSQFHSLRNVAAAISIEAAELQELLLWKDDSQVADMLTGQPRERIAQEIGDILIYALLAAHEAGIDPAAAVRNKLIVNAAKYPVDTSKGNATKYTDLPK